MTRSANYLSVASYLLAVAAGIATISLWPKNTDVDDLVDVAGARADALTVGAVVLAAACVCWVGSAVVTAIHDARKP